jgi:hypothetical protein
MGRLGGRRGQVRLAVGCHCYRWCRENRLELPVLVRLDDRRRRCGRRFRR